MKLFPIGKTKEESITQLKKMETKTIEEKACPLTQKFVQQACDIFRERCYSQPPSLQKLYGEVVNIAREISETISPEQAFLLLQEHPGWLKARANMPGSVTIVTIVAERLAYHLRHTIDERWTTLLLKQ